MTKQKTKKLFVRLETQLAGYESTYNKEPKPGFYCVSTSRDYPEDDKLPHLRYWDGKNWIGKNGQAIRTYGNKAVTYYRWYKSAKFHPAVVFFNVKAN